jgi:phosphate transport system permease protein
MTAAVPGAPLRISDLQGSRSRRRREGIIRSLFALAAGVAVLISVAIVLSLASEAVVFLTKIDIGQLFSDSWGPRSDSYGILPLLVGTAIVALIAMLIATPLGLGAAIFLAEYASPRTRGLLKPILEILAAIPSVVLGYFAITVLSPVVIDTACPGSTPVFTIAAAGVAVGILITPLIASIAEDALFAVPRSLREASYGLGAKKRTTSIRVVAPAATSGIVAALIVGFSRALGETMIVAIAAGGVGGAVLSFNPCLPGQTMTAAMTALAIGSDQAKGGAPFASLFFLGLLLFVLTLVMNLISERFVRKSRMGRI